MEASNVKTMREALKAVDCVLEPCPFCGGKAVLHSKDSPFGVSYAECTVCGVQMGGDSDAEVAELWNNRYERRSVANAM